MCMVQYSTPNYVSVHEKSALIALLAEPDVVQKTHSEACKTCMQRRLLEACVPGAYAETTSPGRLHQDAHHNNTKTTER